MVIYITFLWLWNKNISGASDVSGGAPGAESTRLDVSTLSSNSNKEVIYYYAFLKKFIDIVFCCLAKFTFLTR